MTDIFDHFLLFYNILFYIFSFYFILILLLLCFLFFISPATDD